MPTHQEWVDLVPQDKFDVARARAAEQAGYPEVEAILPRLLEWVRDYNWPVAEVLLPFLAGVGLPLAPYLRVVLRTDDVMSKYWVLWGIVAHDAGVARELRNEIVVIAAMAPTGEDEEELRSVAADILDARR